MTSTSKDLAIQSDVVDFVARVGHDLIAVTEMKTVYCSTKLALTDDVWTSIEASERAVDEVLYGNRDTQAEGILALISNYHPKAIPQIKEKMKTYDENMNTLKTLVIKHCKEPYEAMEPLITEGKMEEILKKESSDSVKWVKWNFDSLSALESFIRKISQPGVKLFTFLRKHLLVCVVLFVLIVTKYQSFKMFLSDAVYSKFRGYVANLFVMGIKSLPKSLLVLLTPAVGLLRIPIKALQDRRKWWKKIEPTLPTIAPEDPASIREFMNFFPRDDQATFPSLNGESNLWNQGLFKGNKRYDADLISNAGMYKNNLPLFHTGLTTDYQSAVLLLPQLKY
jgi:hypothetical protein